MDFKNLAYPFEDVGDAPFNVVRILNECYNDYSNGNLGDGERMASGGMVRQEFFKRIKQIGYDELKYKDIADTLENDVDENNAHLYSKYYEPPETDEELDKALDDKIDRWGLSKEDKWSVRYARSIKKT